MKSTSQPLRGIAQKFSHLLPESLVERLARRSGFVQRRRKLSGFAFVVSFFLCLHQRAFSLRQWAAQLSALSGQAFSKQALDRRLSKKTTRFCAALLKQVLAHTLKQSQRLSTVLKGFARVLVQDSTIFSLHEGLASAFKGTLSAGVQKAAAWNSPPCNWSSFA
jgi:hypothetical protein